jgi:hypothetical protein
LPLGLAAACAVRVTTHPHDQEMIEGDSAGADEHDHDEHDEICKLVETDKVEHVMEVTELGGQDGNDHAHDERNRGEPRRQPQDEQGASNELAVADDDRVGAWRGNMEAFEERGDLVDAVDLAPAGRHEEETHGQAPEQRREPPEALENLERAGAECLKKMHRAVHRTDLSRGGNPWSYGPSVGKLHASANLRNGAWVLAAACAVAACAPGKLPLTRRASHPHGIEPAVEWTYDVHVQGADLSIEATFAATKAVSLATDDGAAPFVAGVEFFSAGRWWPARTREEGVWNPPCLASGCRIRYTFALGEAASRIGSVDTALAAGGLVVAPPSTWLLRPVTAAPSGEGRMRFRVQGDGFASGMSRSATASEFFEASTFDIDAASFAVFGPFRAETVQSGSAHVDVAVAPSGLAMSSADVKAWVERAVTGIAAYYGVFPTRRTLVVVVPGTGADTEGETLGDGGPSVVVRVARGLTASQAVDDWVVVHELLHVTVPSLGRQEAWLSEGIATYVEPIVRARAGIVSAPRFWSDLVKGMPQGLPEAGDQGLERTHTWGRTYWGGALFCLVADVRIRQATRGARSFDDALRGIIATGANVASHWSVDRFLDEGDRATGVTVLRDLYREMGLAPGTVDLEALWKRLGVHVGTTGVVVFDDRTELASVRRAITSPKLSD